MSIIIRHRLRAKTAPQHTQTLVQEFVLGEEAPADSKLMVYLITFAYPKKALSVDGYVLVASSASTKTEIMAKVLDACYNPDSRNPANAESVSVDINRSGVWREWHKQGDDGQWHQHDHVPVLAFGSFRYLAVKRALQKRHGLASHWSKHPGYWSMVRYLSMPSPTKPMSSLDPWPVLWQKGGVHPPVIDCCYAPVTAKASEAKRLKMVHEAAETGAKEPKINDLDVWALVVRAGIRNTKDNRQAHLRLAAYAKEHCGEAFVHYLWKRRLQLPSMIDDFWLWENVEEAAAVAERTRVESLRYASTTACSCNGLWISFIAGSFMQNGIDVRALCCDVWGALRDGRSETTPVVVLAGLSGGEGKSIFLKALLNVFPGVGAIFNTSRESGNFPLLDLPNAKVAFLDEYRFDPEIISWASMCLWFDGSDLPIGRPQNVQGMSGNMVYKGSAPIFVTTKLCDLKRLQEQAQINPSTGSPWDTDAAMLCRRMKVYSFTHRVAKPSARFECCAKCFAELLRTQAGAIFT